MEFEIIVGGYSDIQIGVDRPDDVHVGPRVNIQIEIIEDRVREQRRVPYLEAL